MALDEHHIEEAKSVTERLLKVSPQAGKVMLAVLAIEENKDTASFRRLINEGIRDGFLLSSVMLAMRHEVDGEKEAAANLAEAAKIMNNTPGAMHLRTLATLTDLGSDQSNTVIFTLPVELLEAAKGLANKVNQDK